MFLLRTKGEVGNGGSGNRETIQVSLPEQGIGWRRGKVDLEGPNRDDPAHILRKCPLNPFLLNILNLRMELNVSSYIQYPW